VARVKSILENKVEPFTQRKHSNGQESKKKNWLHLSRWLRIKQRNRSGVQVVVRVHGAPASQQTKAASARRLVVDSGRRQDATGSSRKDSCRKKRGAIASLLPDRTKTQCRNRWNQTLDRKSDHTTERDRVNSGQRKKTRR
jgi:hypothetical protein